MNVDIRAKGARTFDIISMTNVMATVMCLTALYGINRGCMMATARR